MAGPAYTPKLLQQLVNAGPAQPTLTIPRTSNLLTQARPTAPGASPTQPVVSSTPVRVAGGPAQTQTGGQAAPVENLAGLSGSALYEKKLLLAKQALDRQQAAEGEAFGKAVAAAAQQDAAAIQQAQQAYDNAVVNAQNGRSEWGLSVGDTLQKYKAALQAAQDAAAAHRKAIADPYYAKKAQQDDLYQRSAQAVQRMKLTEQSNAGIDSQNQDALKAYNQKIAEYNKGAQSYGDYVQAKAAYDQAVAQRQADIDAGKYNVDPYRFIHQGASLPEILELRNQLNAGVAKPLMRVPTAPTAPTVVQDPGAAPDAFQARQHDAYEDVNSDVAQFLGYQKPEAPAPVTLTGDKAVAPVTKAPAPAPAPEPEKKQEPAAPPPQQPSPPTTQATAQTQAAPLQQTTQNQTQPQAQQPINKATSLAQQTEGTVSGQTSSSVNKNTAQQQPAATPSMLTNPTPFKPVTDEQKDNIWEI